MMLYVAGVPLAVFTTLWWNRKHLNDESSPKHKAVKYEFGALYRQFTPEFWYFGEFLKTNFRLSFCDAMDGSRHVFSCVRPQHLKFSHLISSFQIYCLRPTELIIIITKMLMTGALSVVEPGSPIQLVLATLVMLTFTLITLKLAPYRQKADDWTTFLVSLVITANTQAGFVLLMDKENVPHNFNPENIEVMLLTMNIGVLIVQLLNLVMIKWGCWVKLKAAPCCQRRL